MQNVDNRNEMLLKNQRKFRQIVLNIPHSSSFLPQNHGWDNNIQDCIKELTDWHTDILFGRKQDNVKSVIFGYSRFYCDVERLINDPMEAVGQGIIYSNYNNAKRDLSADDSAAIMTLYHNHIQNLKSHIAEGSFLVDCHSFPAPKGNVDVCIGYNEDWSKPPQEIIDKVVKIFASKGYSVAQNYPYSNSVSPEMPFPYPSLMIELNKRIYLNHNNELNENAEKVKRCIDEVYSLFLGC